MFLLRYILVFVLCDHHCALGGQSEKPTKNVATRRGSQSQKTSSVSSPTTSNRYPPETQKRALSPSNTNAKQYSASDAERQSKIRPDRVFSFTDYLKDVEITMMKDLNRRTRMQILTDPNHPPATADKTSGENRMIKITEWLTADYEDLFDNNDVVPKDVWQSNKLTELEIEDAINDNWRQTKEQYSILKRRVKEAWILLSLRKNLWIGYDSVAEWYAALDRQIIVLNLNPENFLPDEKTRILMGSLTDEDFKSVRAFLMTFDGNLVDICKMITYRAIPTQFNARREQYRYPLEVQYCYPLAVTYRWDTENSGDTKVHEIGSCAEERGITSFRIAVVKAGRINGNNDVSSLSRIEFTYVIAFDAPYPQHPSIPRYPFILTSFSGYYYEKERNKFQFEPHRPVG